MSTNHFGLRPIAKDEKDFRVGALMRLSAEFPETFECVIPPEWIRNQKDDTCANEATSNLLSYINSIRLEALIAWVLARSNEGYSVDDWGLDLRSMLLGAKKVGALPYDASPFQSNGDRSTYAEVANWNLKDLLPKAILYKAGSAVFIEPTNGMDLFDSIKATMFKLNSPVVIGVRWNWDINNPLIDSFSDTGYGHALLVVGWNKTRLKVLNSYGTDVGENGYFFFSREVINHDADIFGAGTLIDETAEKIKWHLDNGIYLDDRNWLLNLIRSFIASLLSIVKKQGVGVPPYPPKVIKMAEAIRKHEGWYIGSRSWRNNNPSNAKYIGQFKAIGKDPQGFAIFPDVATGWDYLCRILYNACSGKSQVYPASMSLYEYFSKYAPSSDNNDPRRYAEVVAQHIGTSPYSKLSDLIL